VAVNVNANNETTKAKGSLSPKQAVSPAGAAVMLCSYDTGAVHFYLETNATAVKATSVWSKKWGQLMPSSHLQFEQLVPPPQ